jgi:hypothetical protein
MRTLARLSARNTALALITAMVATFVSAGSAGATTLTFSTAPVLGNLSAITLNGATQTTTTSTTLGAFAVTSSGTNNGWNMTVASVAGVNKSSVFKEYCPNATCGSDTGPGYVTGGNTLPSGSLTLDTATASMTGSGATKPAFQCGVSPFCTVDTTTPTKIVSASTGSSLTTWTSSGSSTLSLSTPANLHKLQTNEVYRVNLVWTLNSGP